MENKKKDLMNNANNSSAQPFKLSNYTHDKMRKQPNKATPD